MRKLLIQVSYLGTGYCGYQVQPNGISIQQKLNEATKDLFGHDCDIVGCSRTDSGVHARAFCATVTKRGTDALTTEIALERIPMALSVRLPQDICVFDAKWVGTDFHPRYDVSEKEYLYRFYNRAMRDPFEEGRSFHVPKPIDDNGLCAMREAAKTFCGTQDFAAYMAKGSKITDTVRTVTRSEVERQGDVILFRIAADGFLYHMVRILAGTLLSVGLKQLTVQDVIRITESRDRTCAGATLPACGLYLNRVQYGRAFSEGEVL